MNYMIDIIINRVKAKQIKKIFWFFFKNKYNLIYYISLFGDFLFCFKIKYKIMLNKLLLLVNLFQESSTIFSKCQLSLVRIIKQTT